MARSILVATLGFDTKFQMKTLTKLVSEGEKTLDLVTIVRPEEGGDKADRAEEELSRFCKRVLGLNVRVVRTNVLDPPAAISTIFKTLSQLNPELVIADLSGGMRLLILETLAAVLAFNRSRPTARIIVWAEDLSGRVELDPRLFNLPLFDERDHKILEVIAKEGPQTLRELTSKLSMPRSTVHARLTSLGERGFVAKEKDKGSLRYHITQLGMIAYHMGVVEVKNMSRL